MGHPSNKLYPHLLFHEGGVGPSHKVMQAFASRRGPGPGAFAPLSFMRHYHSLLFSWDSFGVSRMSISYYTFFFLYHVDFIYNDTYWDGTFIEEAARRFGLELSLQRRTRHLETRTHHFSTLWDTTGLGEAKRHGIVEVHDGGCGRLAEVKHEAWQRVTTICRNNGTTIGRIRQWMMGMRMGILWMDWFGLERVPQDSESFAFFHIRHHHCFMVMVIYIPSGQWYRGGHGKRRRAGFWHWHKA